MNSVPAPFKPALYDVATVEAMKAVAAGNASEGQQKRALAWIINSAAMTYDETMVPGMPDVASYLQGRRNVGLQIVKLVNLPAEIMDKMKKEHR